MSIGYWETLAAISGDGTAVTNSTARTSLLGGAGGKQGLYTLPPNKLRIGDVLHIYAAGRVTSVVTTPGTILFDLSFGVGGTAAFSSGAITRNTTAQTDVPFIVEMHGTVRTIGNAGNIFWQGWTTSTAWLNVAAVATGPFAGIIHLPFNTAPVIGSNVDMTVANILDFNVTMSVNTATTSTQLHTYVLSLKTSTGF